jgi:hypothetical protein
VNESISHSEAKWTRALKVVQTSLKNDLHELTNMITSLKDTLQNIQDLLKPKGNEIP